MTEFQITAAYILVPLFLIVPLMAKYIDIKHAGIHAARYQAWEYTAWHHPGDEPDILDNYNRRTPRKSRAETARESERLFFSGIDETDPVEIDDDSRRGWKEGERNPLWTDHAGNALYDGSTAPLASHLDTGETPVPGVSIAGFNTGRVVSDISNLFDVVFDTFGRLLDGISGGDAEFSAIHTKGYHTAHLEIPVMTFADAINVYEPGTLLNFNSRAAVLSESWSAGGREHTHAQVAGAVPTTILKEIFNLPGVREIRTAFGWIAPETTACLAEGESSPAASLGFIPEEGSLWLGYIDSDIVHPDRLSEGGVHVCDEAGRCRLESNAPQSHTRCTP